MPRPEAAAVVAVAQKQRLQLGELTTELMDMVYIYIYIGIIGDYRGWYPTIAWTSAYGETSLSVYKFRMIDLESAHFELFSISMVTWADKVLFHS